MEELPILKKGVLELAIFGDFLPEIKEPYIYIFLKFQLSRMILRVKPDITCTTITLTNRDDGKDRFLLAT